jgi:pyruvate,water dikinase
MLVQSQIVNGPSGSGTPVSVVIGLIRGRLYYNMLNWYRVLALLPGFKWNRSFLEQMLGVDEALSQSLVRSLSDTIAAAGKCARWSDFLRLTKVTLRLVAGYAMIGRRIRRFLTAIDDSLAKAGANITDLRIDELAARYRHLEHNLEPYAGTPTLNDFWVMVFHGVLHRLARQWLGPDGDQLCTDLLSSDDDTIGRRITTSIEEMARLAQRDPAFLTALGSDSFWKIRQAMQQMPDFEQAFNRHLERYGDRVPGELKLESRPLCDDPLPLARAVARSTVISTAPAETGIEPGAVRQTAEAEVRRLLAGAPVKRQLFRWVLANTRERLRQRETLRFCRTRIFGLARQLLLHLGRRFWALDLLEDARDVLYLQADEVLAFAEGWAATTDLRDLVRVRKREFRQYESLPQPPIRFEAHDIPYLAHTIPAVPDVQPPQGDTMTGVGCSPGAVQGPVRVIEDPVTAEFRQGEIVVTHKTDPGWITLLPGAGGLLVEVGNPLSHAAIIAREIGLPMIASLPQLSNWLRDGDLVRMDGRAGTITRIRGKST